MDVLRKLLAEVNAASDATRDRLMELLRMEPPDGSVNKDLAEEVVNLRSLQSDLAGVYE